MSKLIYIDANILLNVMRTYYMRLVFLRKIVCMTTTRSKALVRLSAFMLHCSHYNLFIFQFDFVCNMRLCVYVSVATMCPFDLDINSGIDDGRNWDFMLNKKFG